MFLSLVKLAMFWLYIFIRETTSSNMSGVGGPANPCSMKGILLISMIFSGHQKSGDRVTETV